MAKESAKKTKNSDQDILSVARDRYKLAEEADSKIRSVALEDLEFRAGKQWPEDVKAERTLDKRPCLVINRTPQFIRQITNDQRQNRPSIKINPVDDKADVDTAKILQGIVRHVEYNSNADIAYDTSFEGAVIKGFGYYRILTRYLSPISFDQEIYIEPVYNDFSVSIDPSSKRPDGSDMGWGFITSDMPKDDYVAEYGESKLAGMDDWQSIGNSVPGWATGNTCRVAEYFYREWKKATIVQIRSGQVLEKSKLAEGFPPEDILNERESLIPVIHWCKINAVEVLEKKIWPGKWIPILPVYGDILDIDGERILEGVIRHAKDSQRMYNYWASTETETIALAPKSPWIAAEGQIPPEYANQWKTANQKNHSVLIYKPVSLAGVPVGAPQRNVYEAPVQSITNARMQASEDLKATTGIYDAALGNRSNENSGVAIQRRNAQSQTSNFHFIDNLSRTIKHGGRIILDLIPKIYDTARAIRITGEDGEEEVVRINELFNYQGKPRLFNIAETADLYDVTVETGPSYATKRQEAVASMLEMTRALPQAMGNALDLLIKNMDWPGAMEVAERVRKTLPPGLIDDKDKAPVPPEVQAQMQQMGKLIEQLTAQLDGASQEIKSKSFELQSKERIAFAQMDVDMKKELLKANAPMSQALFAQELVDIQNRLNLLNMNQPIPESLNGAVPSQATAPVEQPQPTSGQSLGPTMGV